MMKQLVSVLALAMLTVGCSTSGGEHPEQAASASTAPPAATRAASPAATRTASLPLTKDAVKQIQSALQSKGFYKGPIDGIVGPQTRTALANYKQSEGLPKTVSLDEKTLKSLTGTSTAAAATPPTGSSGASSPPGRMNADQIRNQLQAQGYSDINDVRPWGNQDYTAKADKNGQTYTVEIDGRTGQVISAK